MLWRSNLTTRHIRHGGKTLKALGFLSCYHSSPKVSETLEFSRENANQDGGFQGVSVKPLKHDTVNSVLRNCPSDLLALNFFMWCAKQNNYFHDARAIDYMVGVVEKLSVRFEGVRGIIRGLESVSCVIKPQVFLLLMRIFWRGGMYDKVFDVYEGMRDFGFVPNTFADNVVMDVCFKHGCVDKAIEVLKETPNPNFLSFNIALDNLCKMGDFVNLKVVIRMMMRRGFYPNTVTLANILNGFCKAGNVAEGFQVLGLMIHLGISVSANVWSMLINGFFRSRQPRKAAKLYNKMLETGCCPSIVTYTTLVKGFWECGMTSDAVRMLNTVKSKGLAPDIVLCNVMIDLFTKMGRYDDALDVFGSLSEQELVPDRYTFSSIVSKTCLSRRFDLLEMIGNGTAIELDLVACNSFLNYFYKTRDPSSAVKVYKLMTEAGVTVDSYSFVGVLYALCGEGRASYAINVYNGLVKNYPRLVDAHVHTAIIDGLIKLRKYDHAEHLFRQCILKKYPIDVVSYTVAIRGLVLSRRIEEAYCLFCRMKESGVSPNARTYETIICGLCKAKDTKKAKRLLRELVKEGMEMNQDTLIRVYELLSRSRQGFLEFSWLFETWSSGTMKSLGNSKPGFVNVDSSIVRAKNGDPSALDDMVMDACRVDDWSDMAASAG
ncbi:PREDICTED: putative pentatricopeptide repeat-containing protein At1g16830 [Tarenaya hassleriana]|uniref:putative pentatricopeptide repeat-containing protein At1g16830 n=1 Tax=Tarenaya hassleriana TaxID=28532 RepID=UPI00053C3BD4|nr:PREDICTED: putative pentatricopeptide repeat-containing protein At1g16830 [Tarenaya hassleriana]XP_010537738.1 PREDICTED: putative pentatricopeptide repeat-containing protein At1g16830 [Tarenaya hassleriana]